MSETRDRVSEMVDWTQVIEEGEIGEQRTDDRKMQKTKRNHKHFDIESVCLKRNENVAICDQKNRCDNKLLRFVLEFVKLE
jgi:hypothetical protein